MTSLRQPLHQHQFLPNIHQITIKQPPSPSNAWNLHSFFNILQQTTKMTKKHNIPKHHPSTRVHHQTPTFTMKCPFSSKHTTILQHPPLLPNRQQHFTEKHHHTPSNAIKHSPKFSKKHQLLQPSFTQCAPSPSSSISKHTPTLINKYQYLINTNKHFPNTIIYGNTVPLVSRLQKNQWADRITSMKEENHSRDF